MNNFINVSEIIFKLGGTGSVSKLLKTNPSTISNWKKNNKIPKSYINKLDLLLKERNLDICMEHKESRSLNSTKKKIYYSEESKDIDIEEYIKENNKNNNDLSHNEFLVHGVSSHLKNLKLDGHHVFKKYLTDDEIFRVFYESDMIKKHKMLEECIGYLSNEKMEHRVKFGKHLQKGIKNYIIKRVFCTKAMNEKLHNILSFEYLNFEIIEVESLKENDIVDILDRDYKGIIGFTYY